MEAAPARQALHAVEAVEAKAVRAREEVRVREQLEAALAAQELVHGAAEHVFWWLVLGARRRAHAPTLAGGLTRERLLPKRWYCYSESETRPESSAVASAL